MRKLSWLFSLTVAVLLAQAPEIEFVKIEPGEFLMGCSPKDSTYLPDGTVSACQAEAQPAHRVRITKSFEIGKYEVTQAQWESVMGNNPSFFKGADHPVEQVSWEDVHEFLRRLSARADGYRYRLPTEAEWEYAARAGATGLYAGPSLAAMAWYGVGGANLLESKGSTHPVGQKQPNAWGLYDVHGNVAERVEDWYSPDYYKASPQDDPTGPASGQIHVARGGSWYSNASYVRLANRYQNVAVLRRRDVGFRCVRETVH
jgi:formylglycine-generating enzyme required for sulfatase activity